MNRRKHFRAVATRYDKPGDRYPADANPCGGTVFGSALNGALRCRLPVQGNCAEPGPNWLIATGKRRAVERAARTPTTGATLRQPGEEVRTRLHRKELADRRRISVYLSAVPPELW